ncbi:MAG: 2Fe-2S iron-sulfur cluster binding domain-containing protein [Bdellovibrionaceae bacterium]|nr:2Fe-2S iron-sulfur cluster binding domain-containing protein [Pseudobdellovibrionaceae bacterium]
MSDKKENLVSCVVNGKSVTVSKNTSIIKAFKAAGEDIAHYCYHPGLSVAGCCRLCMVEIEGNPRTQIACNTMVAEGMKITNQSEKIKEDVQWGLDFHLLNHPLDCPICDQAGECGLQEQYMKFGQYEPEMNQNKVKKNKVVSLGEKIVLDTERCILCSRCVRFTDEVSKTHELGIFNRGDRSEVGTFNGKELNNDYALNTVDICPVGALTSKDFRFKQRVWYLKRAEAICTGCSTGCSIYLDYNDEGFFRVMPKPNENNNSYWMCDEGRDLYQHLNPKKRLVQVCPSQSINASSSEEAVQGLKTTLENITDKTKVGVLVTGQYSVEDYQAFFSSIKEKTSIEKVYHWFDQKNSENDFDDLLIRGDKNPNTKGLLSVTKDLSLNLVDSLELKNTASHLDVLIVLGPEYNKFFSTLDEKIAMFKKAGQVFYFSSVKLEALDALSNVTQIPLPSLVERGGTYINYKGLEQKVAILPKVISGILNFSEIAKVLRGEKVQLEPVFLKTQKVKDNQFNFQKK